MINNAMRRFYHAVTHYFHMHKIMVCNVLWMVHVFNTKTFRPIFIVLVQG